MLDAFAVELHQILFDLSTALTRLLVERNADQAVGRAQGLGREAGVFTLDVEKADLAEIEQLFVKVRPEGHAAPVDVVRQVVNQLEAVAGRVAVHAALKHKINVVDRLAVLEPVDQVQRRAANALDGGQVQLHRPGLDFNRLRAEFKRATVSQVRILHAKRHAAGARAMLGGKVARNAFRLAVDNEVDLALAVQHHVLGAVPRHQRETHALKHRLQHARGGRGELDEFKAHQAHRVVKQICHKSVALQAWSGMFLYGILTQGARSFHVIFCIFKRISHVSGAAWPARVEGTNLRLKNSARLHEILQLPQQALVQINLQMALGSNGTFRNQWKR